MLFSKILQITDVTNVVIHNVNAADPNRQSLAQTDKLVSD